MRRTFGLDVLACPRCGGRLRLVALIEEAAVVDRILRHLGLPTAIPAPRPARAPPLPVDVPEGSGWSDPPLGLDSVVAARRRRSSKVPMVAGSNYPEHHLIASVKPRLKPAAVESVSSSPPPENRSDSPRSCASRVPHT
jgi:hypothetical protein